MSEAMGDYDAAMAKYQEEHMLHMRLMAVLAAMLVDIVHKYTDVRYEGSSADFRGIALSIFEDRMRRPSKSIHALLGGDPCDEADPLVAAFKCEVMAALHRLRLLGGAQ